MAAEAIQENSVGWQLQQLSHRLMQWIEWQLAQGNSNTDSVPEPIVWPSWLATLLLWLLMGSLVLLLTLLIWQVADYLLNYRQPQPTQAMTANAATESPQRSVAEWVRQANQLAQAGQWQAACHAFYMAALQKLHDRQWIEHQPSRTDQEYLQLLGSLAQPRPCQLLINTHERSHFGTDRLTEEHFNRCRQAYRELEKS